MRSNVVSDNALQYDPDLAPLQEIEVALLMSDLVGFTKLTERLGDREAYRIIQRHHRIVRGARAAHGGDEIELRGDGFYLAFDRPSRALACAIAIQRSLRFDASIHPEQPISVRMGLHTGPVLLDSGIYFGKTVIESARITELARAGEILVSSRFKRAVADVCFGSARSVKLRGLQHRQQIFSVWWQQNGARSEPHPLTTVNKRTSECSPTLESVERSGSQRGATAPRAWSCWR